MLTLSRNELDTSLDPGCCRLEVRNISRHLGDLHILSNISFQLHEGEILAVVGASGSGKSTLLRLLNRLEDPSAGEILIDGVDHRLIQPQALRRKIGMVMQRAYLFPGTVADNIRFGPLQIGFEVSDSEVEALLDRLGLPGFGDRDVKDLSGGEAQRVSFARTLMNEPTTLLLDEPTSALDEQSIALLEELVREIVLERRLACLIVTHNKPQAVRLAQRAILLARGTMVAQGPVREVVENARS
jgi:putative ABC transport system ATP-binding protein